MRTRTSMFRWVAVAAAVMLLLSGCNLQRRGTAPEDPGSSNVGSGVKLPPELEEQAQQQEQQPAQNVTPAPQSRQQQEAAKKSNPVPPPPPPAAFAAEGEATGIALARRILSSSTPKLVFEIAAVEGTGPNAAAVAGFVNYVSSIVQKTEVEVMPVKSIPRQHEAYDSQKVFEAMGNHRTTNNSDPSVATVWILYVPEFSGAAGVAWFGANGVIAMNHSAVNGPGAAAVGGAQRMERAVLTHEFGHVMSLINLAYKSPRNHEDPNSKGHSRNRNSVMYYAVEMVNPGNVIQGGTPLEFDNDDKADLNDVRDGKLG
ncbi:MAG TPA: hypothetical protein VM840_05805 [Actinomycetota bacterium]|nr:hypothetical protein [Actinomycetota bacterium]